ncbi:haloacid dehalogenase type II [Gloeocapsopsis dulcis]|uniref:Haloacid dehalogenase, type II n=1 Tax=Gloeocapsopsis dulcis AAB1 = 1H9 TaxID=1433147 RepID=A0A6N8FUQ2_9CHRO|nr:haloacid dehalogenase type II [Gloeocapsopsis dulcis]MUL36833.1 haloacid dehalogenase, type II [Gloeocapsopsis dulcis AAB1 = 1H9]WNN88561.1 haloacid dehalogenase type II [Gloeocapsopsis dulcis]
MINFNNYQALTFDCYGTLIDWESGILGAIKSILSAHDVKIEEFDIIKYYSEFEPVIQQGSYIKYREVLKKVVQKFGDRLGFEPAPREIDSLPESLQNWQPFPDTVEALQLLKQKYKLVIISNVDDDLFAATAKNLKVEFDEIITAEQAKSYKPSLNNFKLAFSRIGIPQEQILHVAASLYHDIVPARSLGLTTVWVNRNAEDSTNLPQSSQPNLEVPDLRSLVSLVVSSSTK